MEVAVVDENMNEWPALPRRSDRTLLQVFASFDATLKGSWRCSIWNGREYFQNGISLQIEYLDDVLENTQL